MSRPLTIYIASSFRNIHAVRMLADRLRADGHTILDWTSKAPPLPADMPIEERRAVLDGYATGLCPARTQGDSGGAALRRERAERGDIFRFCAHACARADLVIYIGPAGQDSACEVGMAYTSGVPVYGLRGKLESPGLIMAKAVTRWFDNVDDLLEALYDDQPDEDGPGQFKNAVKNWGRLFITLPEIQDVPTLPKLQSVAEAADTVMHHFADSRFNEADFQKMVDAMEPLRLALIDAGYGGRHEQDAN